MNSFIKRLLASAIAGCLLFSGTALAMGGDGSSQKRISPSGWPS